MESMSDGQHEGQSRQTRASFANFMRRANPVSPESTILGRWIRTPHVVEAAHAMLNGIPCRTDDMEPVEKGMYERSGYYAAR
jgi:hypothetical protein